MNVAKLAMVVVAAIAISGCASFSTPMRNANGHVIECQNSGFGWLGTPVAYAMQMKCESDHRERGYVTFNEAVPAPQKQVAVEPAKIAAEGEGSRLSNELERLHEMFKVGAITQDEYTLAKQRLLTR